jgi:hypothetical protein
MPLRLFEFHARQSPTPNDHDLPPSINTPAARLHPFPRRIGSSGGYWPTSNRLSYCSSEPLPFHHRWRQRMEPPRRRRHRARRPRRLPPSGRSSRGPPRPATATVGAPRRGRCCRASSTGAAAAPGSDAASASSRATAPAARRPRRTPFPSLEPPKPRRRGRESRQK